MPSESSAGSLRPIKILHVVGSLNRGGIETWLADVVRFLGQDVVQMDFCMYRYPGGAYADKLKALGCELHYVPLGRGVTGIFHFTKGFCRLLHEKRYDIVHSHGLPFVPFVLFLSCLRRVPVRLAHAHATAWWSGGLGARLVVRAASLITRLVSTHRIACSAAAGDALFGSSCGPKRRYEVLHCGISPLAFREARDRGARKELLRLPSSAKVVGHVGSFEPRKNQGLLLTVMADILRARKDVFLLLVGEGPLRPEVRRRAAELGISDRVVFTGTSADVPELLNVMDVFVMPSVYEGLPVALLEAQAAGLPCVVSDCISDESVLPGSWVRFVSLDAQLHRWQQAIEQGLNQERRDGIGLLEGSDFDIRVSAQRLGKLYETASGSLFSHVVVR